MRVKAQSAVWRWAALVGLLISGLLLLTDPAWGSLAGGGAERVGGSLDGVVAAYRDLRYKGVIGQTDWWTCGPAAAATVLHHYYGLDADESSVLQLALEAMEHQSLDGEGGITALALVRALAAYGFQTVGYRLDLEALADYFRAGGLPVIVHVTKPQHHWVVAVGLVGAHIVVGDPSWGRRIEPLAVFMEEKGFSGVVLVPLPPGDLLEAGRARQKSALAAAANRLAQLDDLRRGGR